MVSSDGLFSGPLELVLEPSVGDAQIKISGDFDWRIGPEENFPVVVDSFQDWGESNVEQGHVFEAEGIPEDFDFLSFGVGDDLSGKVDLIGHIEDVEPEIVGEVGIIYLLEGGQSKFDDVFDFFSGDLQGYDKSVRRELFS